MDFTYIDSMARLGYQFAASTGCVPHLSDQLGIDAFNAGISNHNVRHGTSVPPIAEFTGEAAPAPQMAFLPAAVEPCPAVVKARVKSIIYDAENCTSFSEEIGQLVRRLMELEAL
jgi:hypothetical protein